MDLMKRLDQIEKAIRKSYTKEIDTAIILGTGLGSSFPDLDVDITLPYKEIEGFPHSTAPSHKGELILGTLEGKNVAIMSGRFHLYEGYSPKEIALPIYNFKRLGAKQLIITNAAGSLNPEYPAASVMMITDHFNLTGINPLIGDNIDELGDRFPDMSNAWDKDLQEKALAVAKNINEDIYKGIYGFVLGPSLETSAERRFLRSAGGDAVGMSTVMENIVANHCNLPCLGFSAITNKATGGEDQQEDTLEEILENALTAGKKITKIVQAYLALS